jgi:hypothetical protein|tara:strand:- start:134 stop:274 length:141 start_codon:yes stop_codon:yes gene_type:complete
VIVIIVVHSVPSRRLAMSSASSSREDGRAFGSSGRARVHVTYLVVE